VDLFAGGCGKLIPAAGHRATSTKQTCNTTQTCISGNGSGRLKVAFGTAGSLALLDFYNWTASLTVDSGNTTPNGFRRQLRGRQWHRRVLAP
jgi:hypothetical protein